MIWQLTLYTRKDCCLCDDMKAVVRHVARTIPLAVEEVNVDSSAELQQNYGDKVPVLLINGRKAFKYRVSVEQLSERLKQKRSDC